jgi:hypothetical protein
MGETELSTNEQTYAVGGTVAGAARGVLAGITVQVVDRNVGGDFTMAEAVTDERGQYTASFAAREFAERGKARPDLQARAVAGRRLLGASTVHYNASTAETLDVLVEAGVSGVPSEYDALGAAIGAHYDGDLAELKEDGERSDVTYLANKSGWDARAVALASLSASLAAQSAPQPSGKRAAAATTKRDAAAAAKGDAAASATSVLQPAHYYALLRAGVAADPDSLYQLPAEAAGEVWKRAAAQGVVPAGIGRSVKAAVEDFRRRSAAQALGSAALPGASTLGEIATLTLGDDAKAQQRFAELVVDHRSDPAAIWDEASKAFGKQATARLRLDGQLALLTLDNAGLIERLHDAVRQRPISSPADLAPLGYHRAEAWTKLIGGVAPEQIPGDTDAERAENYGQLLAAQVRLSFPTATLAAQLGAGEISLGGDRKAAAGAQQFLEQHQADFQIGMQPLDAYLAKAGVELEEPVRVQLKSLQRTYQLTQDEQALSALLENGIDSALQVVKYGRDGFVRDMGDQVGGTEAALQIVARAQQIQLAVLGVVGSYMTTRAGLGLGSDAGTMVLDPGQQIERLEASDLAAGPTLETLFGSLDFCACEECRSVLSPAAYLVDLLLFADRPANEKENPQKVLFERRPDLQHLPLTCENTNTPLPYIDIVNETLEYFVVNDLTLSGYAGHDTDPDTPRADLLASPQFVEDQAYTTLAGELWPPPLPFHRPLETMRRFFATLEVPLAEAMERLRADEAIEAAEPSGYGWRDTLIERLGLSRQEYRLLTDSTIAIADLYGFPAGTTAPQALAGLANVKAFSRRVGIEYDDLIAVLETTFVNPDAFLIPRMKRLGVSFATLAKVKAGTISDEELAAELPPAVTAAEVHEFVAAHFEAVGRLILITPIDGEEVDPCSLGSCELRHADPGAGALGAIDFVRLARFIRLWRKLGWTIAETDEAITALYPADQLPLAAEEATDLLALDRGFATLLPRLGVTLQTMSRLAVKPRKDLAGMLSCWAPIGFAGPDSLYRRLFLGASFLAQDPAFAVDDNGLVLQDAGQTVGEHADALRAATGLSAEELALIEEGLAEGAAARLTLENVSFVYRHAWLARRLRLSVRELLGLIERTGLDPFAPPDPPRPQIAALLDFLEALRAGSLKAAQALYLGWNEDVSGNSAPAPADVGAFARTLRGAYGDVDAQFALVDDPSGEIAQARMTLVYGAETAAFFFALLDGTFKVETDYSHTAETLAAPILAAGNGRLAYDDLRKRLSYAGLLDTPGRQALEAVAGVSGAFKTAVAALQTEATERTEAFFDRYPELRQPYTEYVASSEPDEVRRAAVLAGFLPELVRLRKRQQALASLAAVLRAGPALAEAIADDAAVLHAAADEAEPALDDLAAVETEGLDARLYWSPTVSGSPDAEPAPLPTVEYGPAPAAAPLPANPSPGAPISGVWSGYLEADESGDFGFAVDTDAKTVALRLDGIAVALVKDGERWRTEEPVPLEAGALGRLELTVEKVSAKLALRWQSAGRGREVVPGRRLYPAGVVERLTETYVRTLKAASLATGAKLTAAELAHLAVDPDLHVGGKGWLNALRASGQPDQGTGVELRAALLRMLDFARLKAELSPQDERLLEVVQAPAATAADGTSPLLVLTRWDGDSLDALLARIGKTRADLAEVETFARVDAAYGVVTKLGTSATAAIAAAGNDPTPEAAAAFQAALRARYEEADWLAVLRPINDALRSLQRDALVAYVLRRLSENPATAGVDTPEKLFEYFLMDVEMDPCMETSRIRHALSSVQLFLERCLMNLEVEVAPSSIDAGEWEWMKRYRVWEANRKVFLWPENWLEPELRDDQSPFFKEAMSELLQGDVTEERANTVLLTYLTKLEEVAKLEPCGIYVEEGDPGPADDVAHVVARTAGAKRKYYYRRREYGYWTPWEEVKLEIEDNPVMPVVWKGRIFIFWLRVVKETPVDPASRPTSSKTTGSVAALSLSELKGDAGEDAKSTAKLNVKAMLCYSELVDGKWQPAKTSDPERTTELGSFATAGQGGFHRMALKLSVSGENGDLNVSISGQGGGWYRLYNTHSVPVPGEEVDEEFFIIGFFPAWRSIEAANRKLSIEYHQGGLLGDFGEPLSREVLDDPLSISIVAPGQTTNDSWDAPFFFSDGRYAFYVETAQKVVDILEFAGFGFGGAGGGVKVPEIPPIVWQEVPQLKPEPDPWGPLVEASGFGVTDPSPIAWGVSEDAYINRAFGSVSTVKFGEQMIGPAGAMAEQKGVQR